MKNEVKRELTIDDSPYYPKLKYSTEKYIYWIYGHRSLKEQYKLDLHIVYKNSGYSRHFYNYETYIIPKVHRSIVEQLTNEFESRIIMPLVLKGI